MSAPDVLLALVEAEVVLWVDGDRLRFRAPAGALTDALRVDVGRCRGALVALVKAGAVLPADRSAWPVEAIESFDERAGICEFHGGLAGAEAERVAERCVRLEHARAFVERAALVSPAERDHP